MPSIVKLCVIAGAVAAVVTAPPAEQRAMADGVRAFGYAVLTACTRPGSPCTMAINVLHNGVSRISETAPPPEPMPRRDGSRRELDDSPRPPRVRL